MKNVITITLAMCLTVISHGNALGDDEPLFESLKKNARSEAFTIGALLQVIGDYKSDRVDEVNNGFFLGNVRLYASGNLDHDLSYLVQASFIKSPGFLDAALRYQPRSALGGRFGAFKAPFSAEFILSASGIDFVNRSQAVTLLGPGRQIGLQAQGNAGVFGYALGAFNGNGLDPSGNDNNSLMSAGRATVTLQKSESTRLAAFGASAVHSVDADAPIGFPIGGTAIAEGFSGERILAGADARIELGPWLLAAEGVWSRFDPTNASRVEPWGYYATVGFFLSEKTQILGRWDSLQAEGVIDDSDLVLLGLNYWPTQPTEIQLNLIFETATRRTGPQLLVNVQVAF